jgi:hypothetical protein
VWDFPAHDFPAHGFPANGFPANGFPANGFPANGFPAHGPPVSGELEHSGTLETEFTNCYIQDHSAYNHQLATGFSNALLSTVPIIDGLGEHDGVRG